MINIMFVRMLTSVENIAKDQFRCVIIEGRETEQKLVQTDTEGPPVNSATFIHTDTHTHTHTHNCLTVLCPKLPG